MVGECSFDILKDEIDYVTVVVSPNVRNSLHLCNSVCMHIYSSMSTIESFHRDYSSFVAVRTAERYVKYMYVYNPRSFLLLPCLRITYMSGCLLLKIL